MSDQPSLTDWFSHDIWPGPDYEVTVLSVGQIVAFRNDPSNPIGTVVEIRDDSGQVDIQYLSHSLCYICSLTEIVPYQVDWGRTDNL